MASALEWIALGTLLGFVAWSFVTPRTRAAVMGATSLVRYWVRSVLLLPIVQRRRLDASVIAALTQSPSQLRAAPPSGSRYELFRACAELDRGSPAEAEAICATLAGEADPAVQMVGMLARRRRASDQESWTESFVSAWVEAGRPDMSRSKLLIGRTPWTLTGPRPPSASAEESLFHETCRAWPSRRAIVIVAMETDPADLPATAVLAALPHLREARSRKPDVAARYLQYLASARTRYPECYSLAAEEVLASRTGPLTDDTLRSLAAALALPRDLSQPRSEVFETVLAQCRDAGVPAASMLALQASAVVAPVRLIQELVAIRRVGDILAYEGCLEDLASRLLSDPFLLCRALAVHCVARIAERDGTRVPQLQQMSADFVARRRVLESHVLEPQRWPLPGLWESWSRQLLHGEVAFADKLERAGVQP